MITLRLKRQKIGAKQVHRKNWQAVAKSFFSVRTFTMLLLLAFVVLLTAKPAYYLSSARRGLYLYATMVLPALFPFYFCSLMLTKIGAAKTLSSLFEKPFSVLYHTPKESAYVMLLSMLSGYPVGSACLCELYSAGALTTDDVKSISAFASTSGPAFLLGTLGSAIFDNAVAGVIVLVSHYLGAFVNGFLYKKRKTQIFSSQNSVKIQNNPDNALADSISKSTIVMLSLGGYIVLANMLVDTISLSKIDAALVSALGDNAQPIISLLFGFVEITRGCIECAECSPIIGVALATLIVSFGGLSVTFQNYFFLSNCGMKLSQVLARKTTQAILSFAFAFVFSLIFKKFL